MHTQPSVESAEQGCSSSDNNLNNKTQNGHNNGVSTVYIPPHLRDTVRLIGQHLADLGLQKTVQQLIEECDSQLEHPLASQLRDNITTGLWEEALEVFGELVSTTESGATEIKYRILEQKYLELLESGDQMGALSCLQDEITPLQHTTSKVHLLPSYLMCSTPLELRSQAKWSGATGNSRQRLIHKIQEFLPVTVMLPPKRLEELLKQAMFLQSQQCTYHNTPFPVCSSLLLDHSCSRDKFPSETKQILEHRDEVLHCAWSNSGLYLATGALDGSLYIWKYNPQCYQLVEDKLIDALFSVGYIAWSPDDTMLCICAVEKCPEATVYTVSGSTAVLKCKISQSPEDVLTTCAWSPDNRYIYTGGQQGQFYKYDLHTSTVYKWEGVRLHGVVTLRDNKTVLAADSHKRVRSYNFEEHSDKTIFESEQQIISMSISCDEKYCLLTLAKQGLLMIDIATGAFVRKFYGLVQKDYHLNAFFGGVNEEFIVSGSEDHRVYVYRRNCSTPILRLDGHTSVVNCVSWNPVYTDCFVSGSDDANVRLWAPPLPSDESESSSGTQV